MGTIIHQAQGPCGGPRLRRRLSQNPRAHGRAEGKVCSHLGEQKVLSRVEPIECGDPAGPGAGGHVPGSQKQLGWWGGFPRFSLTLLLFFFLVASVPTCLTLKQVCPI